MVLAGGSTAFVYLLAATLSDVPIFGGGAIIIALVVNALVGLGYLPLFYSIYHASPGKALLGLLIVNGDGFPAAREVVAIRGLVQVFLAPVLLGLIYWWKFFDDEGRTIHEKITNTQVIVVRDPAAAALPKMRRDLLAAIGVRRQEH